MKARHVNFVLIIAFFIEDVIGRHSLGVHTSDLLAHLGASNNHPLIVVVNAKTQSRKPKDSDFDDLYITGDDGFSENDSFVYEEEAKEQAKQLLYSYLLRSSDPENVEENDKRRILREVLRARCKSVVQCEKKCDKKTPKKKNCPKSCRAVFDELNLCEPPKKSNKCDEDSDECGNKSSKKKKVMACEDSSDGCGSEKDDCGDDSDECGSKKKDSCEASGGCGKRGRTLPPGFKF